MLNIAICEDNDYERELLLRHVTDYFGATEIQIVTELHNSGETLLDAAKIRHYDLIFLDIMLGGKNGMTVAKIIREKDKKVCIVFYSSSSEFAVDGYSVDALGYILKPVTNEKLGNLLDKYVNTLSKAISESVNVRYNGVNVSVPVNKIVFIESQDKRLLFHMKDQTVMTTYSKLDEYNLLLEDYPFMLRCHKSYLVNMNFIKKLTDYKFIMTTGEIIPIPRDALPAKKKCYYDYLLDKQN
ncbi:MAG: LytTR family DNA-binding domain-containing protein [Clostridia bacterium]|nr:LytTR family DNA-binding domain-containing protein [Clostridia bacterium]